MCLIMWIITLDNVPNNVPNNVANNVANNVPNNVNMFLNVKKMSSNIKSLQS